MYQAHFGMTDLPFRIAPDPRYYLDTAPNRDALAALHEGLSRGDEFMLLTGEIGTGKTTVARQWLEEVDRRRYTVGEIFGSHAEGDALLDAAVQAFGVRGPLPEDAFLALERFVEQRGHGGRELLLLVDEAQDLAPDALRRLAQLTAMHAGGRGVLHVCLVAHPTPPAIEELAHLGQPLPVGTVCRLRPFDAAQTREYVLHRLQRAGWSGRPAFGAAATYAIHECSGGIPRRINLLCDRILLWQFMEGTQEVSAQAVRTVHEQLQSELGGSPRAPAQAQPPAPDTVPVLDLAAIVSSFEAPAEPAAPAAPAVAQLGRLGGNEPGIDAEPDDGYEYEYEQHAEVESAQEDDGEDDEDGGGYVTPSTFGQVHAAGREAVRDPPAWMKAQEPGPEAAQPRAQAAAQPRAQAAAQTREDPAAPPPRAQAAAPWPRWRWSMPLVAGAVLVVLALLSWQGVRSYMRGFVRTPPLDQAGVMGSGVDDAPGAGPTSARAPAAPAATRPVAPVQPAAPGNTARIAAAKAAPPAQPAARAAPGSAADPDACTGAARTLGLCAPLPSSPQPAAPPRQAPEREAAPRPAAPACEPARAALGLCPNS